MLSTLVDSRSCGKAGNAKRFPPFHSSGDFLAPLVECANDELLKTHSPEVAVDRLEGHRSSAEGLRQKDIRRVPSKHAVAHDFPLLPVPGVLGLARLTGERPRPGPETAAVAILAHSLDRTCPGVE